MIWHKQLIWTLFLIFIIHLSTATANTRAEKEKSCYTNFNYCRPNIPVYHECGTIVENPINNRQRAPWVAGIFRKVDNEWVYLCGATISNPKAVITTASCVQELIMGGHYEDLRRHYKYSTLRVLAGMRSTRFDDRDAHTQEAHVSQIREHRPPILDTLAYQEIQVEESNLAGIVLTTNFNFSDYVRPACVVDMPNTIMELLATAPGTNVTLAGFDVSLKKRSQNGTKLSIHHLTLWPAAKCAQKYRNEGSGGDYHVVCGETSPRNRKDIIPCDMEGHGMMVRVTEVKAGVGSYYLMAIYMANSARFHRGYNSYASLNKESDAKCQKNDVIYFSKHGQHYRWAALHGYCGEGDFQCRSVACRPPGSICDGPAQCPDKSDESWEVCSAQKESCAPNEFRCDYGACIKASLECNGRWDCGDGSDEKNLTKCRQLDAMNNVTCPPWSNRVDLKATCKLPTHLRGHEIRCDGSDGPIPVETEMIVKCARYYLPKNFHKKPHQSSDTEKEDQSSSQVIVNCTRSGNWSEEVRLRCRADCGISQAKKDAYVIGGQVVAAQYRSRYPWIASLFQRRRRGDKDFLFVCGGTLISPNVVLTAAHCVTRGDASSKYKDLRVFKIFFGKITSNISETDEHTQELTIKEIFVKENYNPNNYEGDIALLILNRSVIINDHVRPACVPTPEDYQLTESLIEMANPNNGTILGTVVGFGKDETHMASVELRRLKMPIVPRQQCQDYLKTINFHIYISETWLCAGHTNGSAVCEGDSGSGLVLPHISYGTKQYFVEGIVSHGPNLRNESDPCSSKSYKIFTKAQSFSQWIHRYLDQYQSEDDEDEPIPNSTINPNDDGI